MKYLTAFEGIRLSTPAPYIPYSYIHSDLINCSELQKELRLIKSLASKKPLPYSSTNHSYLLKVARLFGVKLTFKQMTDDEEARGYCWPTKNKIQVILKEDFNYNKRTLTHEIGHILQIKLGLYVDQDTVLLSNELKSEQQAETLSYYLCKILWPKEKFPKKKFNCYFEEEDIVWLDSFYKKAKGMNYINDLFEYI